VTPTRSPVYCGTDCSSTDEPFLNRDESCVSVFDVAIAAEARAIARRIRGPAPHRQMLGKAAISASVGRGLAFNSAAIAMIMPVSQ
jgi:hypothetical protein